MTLLTNTGALISADALSFFSTKVGRQKCFFSTLSKCLYRKFPDMTEKQLRRIQNENLDKNVRYEKEIR